MGKAVDLSEFDQSQIVMARQLGRGFLRWQCLWGAQRQPSLVPAKSGPRREKPQTDIKVWANHSMLMLEISKGYPVCAMDQGSMFEFSNGDLQCQSFSTFQEMKESGELCDVIIKVRDQSFAAHRVVLSAAIPFFRAMFRSKLMESIEGEVVMDKADPAALKSLLSFAYTGKLTIQKSKVQSLLQMSIFLQLDCVVDACFVVLVKEIDADNVLSLRAFAENVNHMNTVEIADCFIKENFDDVSATQSFLDLPLSVLRGFLCRNDLNVTSEQVVFEAVLKWVKASEAERKPFLNELLAEVRLGLLTPEYLAMVCTVDELFRTEPCRTALELTLNHLEREPAGKASVSERYCKEKHHLKCERVMGSGMYNIIKGSFSGMPCLLDYLLKHCLFYYDVFKKEWVELLDIREIGNFNYAVCLNDEIHLIRVGLIHTVHLRTLKSSSLKCKCKIPTGGSIALHNGRTYILGSSKDSERSVYFLDPQEGFSTKVGEIINFRKEMGVASLGEHIYVTGGEDPVLKTNLDSVEQYNPLAGLSKLVAPMNYARSGHGCATLGGKMYVCGGKCVEPTTAEVYDPAADQWNFIACLKSEMLHVSLVPYDGKLHAAEIRSAKVTRNVEIYNPQQDMWKCDQSKRFSFSNALVTNSAATLQF